MLLLVAAATLVACSGFAASNEEIPPVGPDPNYMALVADRVRSAFKDYAAYDQFQISEPRWVHAVQGWSWVICVRFSDRGRTRNYALYLQSGKIIDSRYAVATDGCDVQAYAPFALMAGGLQPLH